MGTLSFDDFHEEILAATGNRTGDTAITRARSARALNLAQQRVNQAAAFRDLDRVEHYTMTFTGVAFIDIFFNLPDRVRSISSFVLRDNSGGTATLGQSRKLIQKPRRWFDSRFPVPDWLAPSWPSYYALWDDTTVVFDCPRIHQFQAQIRFTRLPANFTPSEGSNTSTFEDKDFIILNFALAFLFQSLGRNDRALYFELLAEKQLAEAIELNVDIPDLDISRGDAGMAGAPGEYWRDPFFRGTGHS